MPRATDVDAVMQGLNSLSAGFQRGQERRDKQAMIEEEARRYKDEKAYRSNRDTAEDLWRNKQLEETLNQRKEELKFRYDDMANKTNQRIQEMNMQKDLEKLKNEKEVKELEFQGRVQEAKALKDKMKWNLDLFTKTNQFIQDNKDNPDALAKGLPQIYYLSKPDASKEELNSFVGTWVQNAQTLKTQKDKINELEKEYKQLSVDKMKKEAGSSGVSATISIGDEGQKLTGDWKDIEKALPDVKNASFINKLTKSMDEDIVGQVTNSKEWMSALKFFYSTNPEERVIGEKMLRDIAEEND
jgi:hypothetical protein